MTMTGSGSVRDERDTSNEPSGSGTDPGPPPSNSTDTLENGSTEVGSEKLNAKQQAEELARMKEQVAMLTRLFGGQLPAASVAPKKAFTGIKIYGKDPQLYYGHDHFKYDNYVYEMEKIFKSNEGLEDARDPEEHKVAFSTSWLAGNASQVWRTKERVAPAGKYTWKDVKETLLKHVPRAKSLNDDNYVKWKSTKQQTDQDISSFYSRITFLESHLPEDLKPNAIQQLSNFRSGLRIEHQEKLKNLPEMTNLQDLIDQVMSFEEGEALAKAHKKGKLNARGANSNEREDDTEGGDSKRSRGERRDDRGRGRGRGYRGRGGSRGGRGGGNNPNYEPVTKKGAWDWFNSQTKEKQDEVRAKKACFGCGESGHGLRECKDNPENVEKKGGNGSKN